MVLWTLGLSLLIILEKAQLETIENYKKENNSL